MVDRVRNGERMDVDAGFGQSLTYASKCAGAIFKKHGQLRHGFQGENRFHLEFTMMPSVTSDNSDRSSN
jgi:hypothetical protein